MTMKLFAEHLHKSETPWDQAPLWALELREMMSLIIDELENDMSALADLNNAVTALATGFTALDAAVQTELSAIKTALAAGDDVAVEQAASNIQAITNKMATDAASLTASIPAATTVPAPAAPAAPAVAATVTPPAIAPVTVSDPSAAPPTS